MGRTDDRAGFTDDVRLRLLEQDADRSDGQFDRLVGELASLRKVMSGILAAVVTASILLAINVIVLRAGS